MLYLTMYCRVPEYYINVKSFCVHVYVSLIIDNAVYGELQGIAFS